MTGSNITPIERLPDLTQQIKSECSPLISKITQKPRYKREIAIQSTCSEKKMKTFLKPQNTKQKE